MQFLHQWLHLFGFLGADTFEVTGLMRCCRQAPKRSLAARLEMGLDVARGMAALEENDPPIVHRDLKPTNIFIDAGQS